MRYIRTSNQYVEFIEANNEGNILSTRGFQFGELYFKIQNGKVTFYLNDQENPWRNDVWSIDIPFELDEEVYDNEDDASAALHSIMNDRFQEQIDQLKEDLSDEVTRSTAKDVEHDTLISGLTEDLNNEIERAIAAESAITDALNAEIVRSTTKDVEHDALISVLTSDLATEVQNRIAGDNALQIALSGETDRAISAETALHNEILAEEARAISAETALDAKIDDEITRSTSKDASQDALISGLTTSLQNEINRAVGAENSLRNDLNSEISARTSADSAMVQRITALEVGKADKSDVYTKAESDNKYATKEYVSGNTYTKAEIATMMADKADKANAVSTALYNSQNKTIDFKNINGNVIASVDARDFIKDGMVDTVSVSGNNLVITFNTDAGKEDIVVSLPDIFDPTNYYDKSDVDNIVSGLNNSIDSKLDASAYTPTDLSNYYSKQEVDASQLAQDNKIDAISGNVQTLSGNIQTISGDVQTLSGEVQTISGNAITTGDVQTMIDNSISGKQDTLSAGTNIQINNNVISATDTKYTAGSGITISGADNKIAFNLPIYKGGGILSVSINNQNGSSNYYNKINGNTSIGAGYMINTTNVDEAAFGTSNISKYGNAETFTHSSTSTLFSVGNGSYNDRHNAFEIKQNGDIYIADTSATGQPYNYPMIKLQDALGGGGGGIEYSAGTNVQINDHVISATDTTYSAGDGISISNGNVISTTTKFWCGTQAQYDAISVKDPNTVYMIHD